MHHLSTDLETLATSPNAVILAIGAVFFDPATGVVGPAFYRNITRDSQLYRRVDDNTVAWWATQPQAARDALEVDQRPLDAVLAEFSAWIKAVAGENTVPWGNGASFDLAILTDAFTAEKKPVPWKFWNERCLRTLKNLVHAPTPAFVGVPHNAADDALHQANMITGHMQKLDELTLAYVKRVAAEVS